MNQLNQAVISTLLYYHLLNRPLTSLELFKFLPPLNLSLRLGQFLKTLREQNSQSLIYQWQGFYFLRRAELLKETQAPAFFALRQKRTKISQLKWQKVKKMARLLPLVPFLQMLGVTGSLTLDNTHQNSDFDFLIIFKPGRLWIGRTAITLLLSLFGWRRHGEKTKDRVCLNCYLASSDLQIKPEIKPRDLHSAQEYGRLIPIWQVKPDIFFRFQAANDWIKDFVASYPWPATPNLKIIKSHRFLILVKKVLEWLLANQIGDWLEKWLATWQVRRISRKINQADPADQIYVSEQCLMFHPQSKSLKILAQHQAQLKQLLTQVHGSNTNQN